MTILHFVILADFVVVAACMSCSTHSNNFTSCAETPGRSSISTKPSDREH